MLNLEKTTDLVKREIESDIYMLEILKDGLVNVSALARKILPAIKKENPKATAESISVAIKRYIETEKSQKLSGKLKNIIANTQIAVKNDIVHMTFKRNQDVANQLSRVSSKIRWDEEEIFFVNQGSGEITVVLDKKNKKVLDACKGYCVEQTSDLGIISLKESFQKEGYEVPGLYAYFISQISRRGINLTEIISTLSQLTFVVKDSDLIKAYETLSERIKYFRKKVE